MTSEIIIIHTQQWLKDIVIKLNFCPFANQPFIQNSIRYVVVQDTTLIDLDTVILHECHHLNEHPEVETTLIILADLLQSFSAFNLYIQKANRLLEKKKIINTYQLAHFHPEYMFEMHDKEDVANYTNRSPYPTLHIIRQQSITEGLKKVPEHAQIPNNNILTARTKGASFFQNYLKNLVKQ
jgi:hypothetical protein